MVLYLILGAFTGVAIPSPLAPQDGTPVKPPAAAPPAPLRLEGRWVLDAEGKAVGPRDFERGLQTSALVYRVGELWSIGDQRAEWPGQILRIDPRTARLVTGPLPLKAAAAPGGEGLIAEYLSIRNSDFEGLAEDPRDPTVLYGVTEDKRQWIVRIRLSKESPARAAIERIIPVEFPAGLLPYKYDLNYRVEGIAVSDDGRTVYLAWERAADGLPRIFTVSLDGAPAEGSGGGGGTVMAREAAVDFASLGPRADKPQALLNLNDIFFLRRGGRPMLLALARDQERILSISLEGGKVERAVDLDLRGPGGEKIHWVSPEGLAVDPARDRLWIINDPDSIRGNYRASGGEAASGNYAAMVPLLYETRLSAVLGEN